MTDNMQRARELLEDAMGCAIEHNLSGKVSMPAALDAIAAALRLAVPDGMVLVPVKPTDAMWRAFRAGDHNDLNFHGGYAAMLAAAPTVSAEGEG